MGRFVYWMNVSLDLRIEAAPGEDGGGDWMRIGEPLHREFNRRARELSLMVQGRRVFEIMEAYWPAARDDASLPEYLQEYGAIWTDAPKILVSRTRAEAPYSTRVVGEDAIARLAEVRAGTDGDIGVGGATLATALLRAGLLDELLLFTHPAILGSGRPLFDDVGDGPVQLDLLEQAAFDEGVTMHRYAVRR
jgi:dihydrofolate reductase